MRQLLKISEHKHSGRIRPHEHTSYLPLLLLVVGVGIVLAVCTASAAPPHPDPQAGSIGLSGTVPKKPPTTAAVIQKPTNGQRFSTSPITVSGTCPAKNMVEIYKNDIFAGSGPCGDNGTFSFDVDLLYGKNDLVARVYDVLNQAGPDSTPVTVFYDALPAQAAPLSLLNFSSAQLLLNTDAVYRGVFPEQMLNIPINIIGGQPPYAIEVRWGDTTNKMIPRNDNVTFNASHVYHKAGTYPITLQATDAQDRVAFLTVAAVVNGQPPVASIGSAKPPSNKFLVMWPLYASAVTLVFSFWLGEQREKKILHVGAPVYHT